MPLLSLPPFLRLVLIALLLAAVLLSFLTLVQDRFMLFPDYAADAPAPTSGEDWTEQGVYLGRSYHFTAAVKGTILVYHGNAGTIALRDTLARTIASHGWRVVLVEYPGYGKRAGKATLKELVQGSLDAFTHARARWPGPLFVAGESLGTGMAAQVAGAHPDAVDGVLLITPFDALYKVVDAKLYGLPFGILLHHRLDSQAALSRYPGKVAIMASRRDAIIPVAHARALAQSLPHALYLELPEAGHNDWLGKATAAQWERLLGHLIEK